MTGPHRVTAGGTRGTDAVQTRNERATAAVKTWLHAVGREILAGLILAISRDLPVLRPRNGRATDAERPRSTRDTPWNRRDAAAVTLTTCVHE